MKVSGISPYYTNTIDYNRQSPRKYVMFGDLIRNDFFYKTVPLSEENKKLLEEAKNILSASQDIFDNAFDKFMSNFMEKTHIILEDTRLENPYISHITSKSHYKFSESFLPTATFEDRYNEIPSYYLTDTKANKVLVLTDNEIADNNNMLEPVPDLNKDVQEGLKAIIKTHKANSSYQSA